MYDSLRRIFKSAKSSEVTDKNYPLASYAYQRSHFYKEISEYESRLQELVDYFGYEKGSKAPYCRIQGGQSMPIRGKLLLTDVEYSIMHQYALFNRMSPERYDMYYIFDEVVKGADRLGGPKRVCVIDFGCGLGQIGMAFASVGYMAYCVDVKEVNLSFLTFCAERRGLTHCVPVHLESSEDFISLKFERPVGVAVEWSTLEHVANPLGAYRWLQDIIVPGGLLVTTTAGIQWNQELEEVYRKDVGEEKLGILRSEEFSYISSSFSSLRRFEKSIASVFIK